ncbi:FAD-binding oxidoreductase [Aurantimonas sp. DM33-3]|uniref:NAD(P)/FAD-dependent oxidoreductase n=1 Tax=Aurantimonas sp. DM33-3 TaxID=2766955 RepID=UPI001651E39C|nr:FAD-binding oxidoreductase [Aurantimonas sp. DM33-3]MBC6718605.1 FAD-binding oxidoreductase [Aurantimonas sp. DM33-3]
MSVEHPDSFWRATANSGEQFSVLDSDRSTETLIIGGGFTGLSTARELLSRGRECLVLEAHDIGWGASGRTGGFAVPRFKMNYSTLALKYGHEVAHTLYLQALEAVDSVAETVESYKIDCSFQRNGHLTPAHTHTALTGLQADVDWLRSHANDSTARIMGLDETSEALGTTVYKGAYLDPRGACLHPFNYTRGLARGLEARGVPIMTNSPVVSLHRDGDRWVARTPAGAVRAKSVVLATNAYTRPLLPRDDLNRRVVPVASSVITTRPLNSNERKKTLPCELPVTDTRRLVSYFRILPTGQLMFGGRGDITGRRDDPAVYRTLERQLALTYPHLQGIEIEERWAGMVAVTLDSFPHIGKLEDNVFYALGYGGRGVALSSLMGRRLAALVSGERIDPGPMGDDDFTTVPFHAWRRTGMRIMARYYQIRDRFER